MRNRVQSNWGVSTLAGLGLAGPDLIKLFESFGPILDGLVRLGQFGVAVATIFYIARKCQAVKRRKKKKEENLK